MVDTVGAKLQKERQRRRISLEEAARSTRMRPDKILDLEKDNYTNFPNMTYAKSFLLIYAKFLDVDVSEFVEHLETTNPVGIEDYEYLNAAERTTKVAVYRPPRKPLWPLVLSTLVLMVVLLVVYFIITLQRLAPDPARAIPTPTPAPRPVSTPSPAVVAATPVPEALDPDEVEVVPPAPVATPSPAAAASATPEARVKEVVIKPIKKTWVKIVKDVADSPPIFEDWLYPDALPLKLRGTVFWIEVKEPAAVKVTRNGQPVTMDATKVTIQ